MIEAYWLNVGSLILGLIAWGMPIRDMVQYFYIDYLVKIEDWTALMDTSYAVAFVSLILLMVTIILNVISLALCYRGEFCEKENSY